MKYIDAERLKEAVEKEYNSNYTVGGRWELGYDTACEQILDIIDSLQQEQPEVDFKIEERKWVHNAVDNVFPEDGDFMSEVDFRKILKDTARHFAKWQKEQMMKEAVEGTVYGNGVYTWVAGDIPSQFKYGDKVRVIVLPKKD